MPIENIQEFRSFGAWNGSFAYSLQASFQVAKVAGPRNHRPDRGPSNGAVAFYDAGCHVKSSSIDGSSDFIEETCSIGTLSMESSDRVLNLRLEPINNIQFL